MYKLFTKVCISLEELIEKIRKKISGVKIDLEVVNAE